MLTVAELIKRLKKFDPNLKVKVRHNYGADYEWADLDYSEIELRRDQYVNIGTQEYPIYSKIQPGFISARPIAHTENFITIG